MAQVGRKDLHYVIAGRGDLKEHLELLAKELGVSSQLHLLGFRTDVKELFKMADFFAHPSFREGLSVAVMEAMANALPIICTEIRGNTDLIEDKKGGYLFKPAEQETAYQALKSMMESPNRKYMGQYNLKKAEGLDIKAILEVMRKIYG
jgi:glycosyltransferase involved in cell wall biosynthesis